MSARGEVKHWRVGPALAGGAVVALGVALALVARAADRPARVAPGLGADTVASRRVSSLRHLPGYRPKSDPDSMSVFYGRRLDAPIVSMPFHGGARSLDDLGRAVCRALNHRDADSLLALCIRDEEFRDVLWREFPQSRPATGLEWEDAWKILEARLHAGCVHAIRDHGNQAIEFVRFERTGADTLGTYNNFRLHGGLAMVVRSSAGERETWRWLRAVAERKGRFKIYSTDD